MTEIGPSDEAFWEGSSLRLDRRTERLSGVDGTPVLVGGAPLRLLRLSAAGGRRLDRWLDGDRVGADGAGRALARRLCDGGLAHPVPVEATTIADADAGPDAGPDAGSRALRPSVSAAIVVPVFEDPVGLAALLASLDTVTAATVVVVDDGSGPDPAAAIAAAARAGGARLVRLPTNAGPAAARNAGWRSAVGDTPGLDAGGSATAGGSPMPVTGSGAGAVDPDVVVFVDADVVPDDGWLEALGAAFADPTVVAAAPRVRASPGTSPLDRYERHHSPLDLGPDAGPVGPEARITYLPSACLAIRVDALRRTGGFDERLRSGEDVDLVWRLTGDGARVRYEADVVVHHRNRASWSALARQRFGYGRAAAPLDRRHPGNAAPLRTGPWSAVALAAALLPGPGVAVGAAIVAGSTVQLARQLTEPFGVRAAARLAVRIAGGGHAGAALWTLRTVRRAWLPVVVVAASRSRRARRCLALAAVVPPIVDRYGTSPQNRDVDTGDDNDNDTVGLATQLVGSAVDDTSYCAGVWVGSWSERRFGALRPRLTGSPTVGTPAVARVTRAVHGLQRRLRRC